MEKEKIIEALRKTWDYIGDDVIVACGGKADRSVVIETTVDRVDMFDKEVSKALMDLSQEEIERIGKEAFPWEYCVY